MRSKEASESSPAGVDEARAFIIHSFICYIGVCTCARLGVGHRLGLLKAMPSQLWGAEGLGWSEGWVRVESCHRKLSRAAGISALV